MCCHPTRTHADRANNQSTLERPCYIMTTWSSCSGASRVLEPAASQQGGKGGVGKVSAKGTFHTFKEFISGMHSNVGANPHSCKSICGTITVLHIGPVLIGHRMACALPSLTPRGILPEICHLQKKSLLLKSRSPVNNAREAQRRRAVRV